MSCRRQNLEVSDEVKDRLLQYYSGASGADGNSTVLRSAVSVSLVCVCHCLFVSWDRVSLAPVSKNWGRVKRSPPSEY